MHLWAHHRLFQSVGCSLLSVHASNAKNFDWTTFFHSGYCIAVDVFVLLFAFSALTLLVGRQEGHPACKKTEWWGAGVVICLERYADLRMAQLMPLPLTVSCFSKIPIGFTFLVPAHLGSPHSHLWALCSAASHPSVCLSHAPSLKTVNFRAMVAMEHW